MVNNVQSIKSSTISDTIQKNSKWVHVCLNGNINSDGIKCLITKKHFKSFEGFLNHITDKLKPCFGAIRNLYSLDSGRKILDLDDLLDNQKYVATGNEKFKLFESGNGQPADRAKMKLPFRRKNAENCLPTFKLPNNDTLTLFVFRNGDDLSGPMKFVLRKQDITSWDKILQIIAIKIQLHSGRIKRLCSLDGEPIRQINELKSGEHYVAVGTYEPFKKLNYNIEKHDICHHGTHSKWCGTVVGNIIPNKVKATAESKLTNIQNTKSFPLKEVLKKNQPCVQPVEEIGQLKMDNFNLTQYCDGIFRTPRFFNNSFETTEIAETVGIDFEHTPEISPCTIKDSENWLNMNSLNSGSILNETYRITSAESLSEDNDCSMEEIV